MECMCRSVGVLHGSDKDFLRGLVCSLCVESVGGRVATDWPTSVLKAGCSVSRCCRKELVRRFRSCLDSRALKGRG